MADIRDPQRFMDGRWRWTSGGYERGLARGCAIGDLDGVTERNGYFLVLEGKEWHRDGPPPAMPTGQRLMLQALSRCLTPDGEKAFTVFVLAGCAHADDPARLHVMQDGKVQMRVEWPTAEEGRAGLRDLIAVWAVWAEMGLPWYAADFELSDPTSRLQP